MGQFFHWGSQLINFLKAIQFPLGNAGISLWSLLELGAILVLLIVLIRSIKSFFKQWILVHLGIDEGNREAIATIISYGIGTFLLIILMQITGINLASFAVILGGLGIGIGLGLQEITRNFVSGLTMLLDRSIKVGNFIEIYDLSGYVREISLLFTIIRTRDGADVIVPNTDMVLKKVVNWSFDTPKGRIKVPVYFARENDPLLVTEALLKAVDQTAEILKDPAPKVMFWDFEERRLSFEIWVWIERFDREPFVRSNLNFNIEYQVRQYGLLLNYNEMTVRPFKDFRIAPLISPIRDMLRQVTYFQSLSDVELRHLIEIGQRQRLTPGQILFEEGDPGDAFYIILEGSVEIYLPHLNRHLTNLHQSQFFGELALILGIPRTAAVRATEDTLLFAIRQEAFQGLMQQYPDFSEALMQELDKHQTELAQRQEELRALGLVDAIEDDTNPLLWMRKRIRRLFDLMAPDLETPYFIR